MIALKYPRATGVIVKKSDEPSTIYELDTDYIINAAGYPEASSGSAITAATELTSLTATARMQISKRSQRQVNASA